VKPDDFDAHFAETHRQIASMHRAAKVGAFVYLAIVAAVLGGIGWVAYRLVVHFT
jgi:hypothetical protein